MSDLRIGCGAAGEPDRPELALQMVRDGHVDYVCFDTLAERTLAAAQLRRAADASAGYDLMLRERVGAAIAPALDHDTVLIGNMGGANPRAAADVLAEAARAARAAEVTIAVVEGDDVLDAVRSGELPIELWNGGELGPLRPRLVSANAYLGAAPIAEALAADADVIVTGRGADVAPYIAAISHRYGWDPEDWDRIAAAAAVGHLLECGRCVTGTCYEEPAFGRLAPDPDRASLPLATVAADGDAVISKVPGTGGLVTRGSCAEQLLHEIGDPARYLTPDVTLDMTGIELTEVGPDHVRVSGARGGPPPDRLKLLLGVDEGYFAEGEVSFAGRGAVAKARRAAAIVRERFTRSGHEPLDWREDLIGVDSVLGPASPEPAAEPWEVRLRLAVHVDDAETAAAFELECQDLWWAPGVGGGGVRTATRPVLGMHSASAPREAIDHRVTVTAHRFDEAACL